MRRLVALAVLGVLGAALIVSGSLAQTNQTTKKQGSKDLNGQFGAVGGGNMQPGGDSTSYQMKVNSDGSVDVRRVDNPEWRDQTVNLIFAPLGANGGTVLQQYPWPIKGVKLITLQLQLQMSAAADTDSVNVIAYASTKRTDQLADGVSYAWDADQTDSFRTPIYFTRNQYPYPAAAAAGFKYTRRIYGTTGAGHGAMATPLCFTAPLVDDSGAPLMGDYLVLQVFNLNPSRSIQLLTVDVNLHYE